MILPRAHPHTLKAFSLIELLSVIAVIALLAAILVPVVSSIRESSDTVQCASNLRQLTAAAGVYATEHGGHILPPVDNKSGFQQWMFNHDFLDLMEAEDTTDLTELSDYFRCPTAVKNGSTIGLNYGMNLTGITIDGEEIAGNNYKKAGSSPDMQPPDPAKAMYLMDGLDWWIRSSRATTDYGNTGEAKTVYAPAYRHHNGLNISFYDGHVEYRTREEMIENINDWSVSR